MAHHFLRICHHVESTSHIHAEFLARRVTTGKSKPIVGQFMVVMWCRLEMAHRAHGGPSVFGAWHRHGAGQAAIPLSALAFNGICFLPRKL